MSYEEQMGVWIDAAPVAMLVADPEGRILIVNRAASTMFGYTTEALRSMNVDELVPVPWRAMHHQQVASFFRQMTPRSMGVGREVNGVDSAGRVFPVEIGLSPVATASGPRVVAAIVDITERKRRDRESTLARLVQEAMLPTIPNDLPGVAVAARSDPADATGGDFYDLIQFSDGRVGIVIGDASGHGFAAALVTASARSYLRALLRTEDDLGDILRLTNSLLLEDVLESHFVTLLFVVIDPTAMELVYAGAGHAGYLLDRSGRIKCCLDNTGLPLGWQAGSEYPVTRMPLEDGDLVVLLTDGIEEAMDPDGNHFGQRRVLDLLASRRSQPVSDIVGSLHEAVRDFHAVGHPHDDATVLVARVVARPPVHA